MFNGHVISQIGFINGLTNKLDLPAPDGPMMASNLPGSKYPEMDLKICLPPNTPKNAHQEMSVEIVIAIYYFASHLPTVYVTSSNVISVSFTSSSK